MYFLSGEALHSIEDDLWPTNCPYVECVPTSCYYAIYTDGSATDNGRLSGACVIVERKGGTAPLDPRKQISHRVVAAK
eukprot:4433292-Karenia_brevis.AAC.1